MGSDLCESAEKRAMESDHNVVHHAIRFVLNDLSQDRTSLRVAGSKVVSDTNGDFRMLRYEHIVDSPKLKVAKLGEFVRD